MVNSSTIKKALADLKTTGPAGLTAVVVGGTNGIGNGFLYKLAEHTNSPKIYIIGRKESSLTSIISDLKTLNPSGTYIPIQADDLTLLSCVSKATAQILSLETSKIDLLFLSPGYLTLHGRNESPEGLDKITAIRYYGRIRFILDLLPLLEKSPNSPRVLSILNAGGEAKIVPEDLGLRDPKNSGPISAVNAATTYMTLAFEHLAREHPRVSFVHAHPGVVRTNIFNAEHFHPAVAFFMNKVVGPTLFRVVAISKEEAGERALYEATFPGFLSVEGPKVGSEVDGDGKSTGSDVRTGRGPALLGSDGRKGSGAYIVNAKCEALTSEGVLKEYRADGTDKEIWEHTVEELERVQGLNVPVAA